jgi:hypothetical protein
LFNGGVGVGGSAGKGEGSGGQKAGYVVHGVFPVAKGIGNRSAKDSVV